MFLILRKYNLGHSLGKHFFSTYDSDFIVRFGPFIFNINEDGNIVSKKNNHGGSGANCQFYLEIVEKVEFWQNVVTGTLTK